MSNKKVQPLNMEKDVLELYKGQSEDNDSSRATETNRKIKKSLQKNAKNREEVIEHDNQCDFFTRD